MCADEGKISELAEGLFVVFLTAPFNLSNRKKNALSEDFDLTASQGDGDS